MRRPLFALVPHRGVVWTGISRAVVSRARDEQLGEQLVLTIAVSARVASGAWVPGEPEMWIDGERAGATLPRHVPVGIPTGTQVSVASKAWAAENPGAVSVVMDAGRAVVEPDRGGRAKATLEMTSVPGDTLSISDRRATLIEAKIDWGVRMRLDWLDGNYAFVSAHCVDVAVELDEAAATFLFVGLVQGTALERKLDRVAVAVLPLGLGDPWWAELPRAVFRRCALPEDLDRGERPTPLTTDELTAARYLAWDVEPPPSRLLDEAEATAIMRKLTLGYERDEVLSAFGLDAYEWSVEERAVAMSLATDVEVPEDAFLEQDAEEDGRSVQPWSPAERFATSFESQRIESKARLELAAFASLKARMEVGDSGALRLHSLTEASYAAEEDAWSARADADPDVARELSSELDKARAEAEVSLRERVTSLTGQSTSTETEEAS